MAPDRPISELDWQMTPETVRQYIVLLEQKLHHMQLMVQAHETRIEKLEVQTEKNSHNSSKPPSSDPPFNRKKRKSKKGNRPKVGQKGHKAHQQQVLDPTDTHWSAPERCTCGHTDFDEKQMQVFYAHQHIERPKIEMEVSHTGTKRRSKSWSRTGRASWSGMGMAFIKNGSVARLVLLI
jgi:transposase